MLKPVRRQSLSDAVFEQLRNEILSGKIEPGTPLPAERALCEMLGVNRGALREALKRLEQARLVSIQHGGTTRVANFLDTAGMDILAELLITADGQINTKTGRSVVEMRSALAPQIARLAALRATPEINDQLRQVVEAMARAAGDLPQLQQLAIDFWRAIVEGSDNIAFRLSFNALQETYTKLFDVLTQVLAEELTDLPSYRGIAAAIERKDATRAERRAAALVHKGAEQIVRVVETLDRLQAEAAP